MGTDCMPFNQARGSVTLRAANSRPYDSWAEFCPPNYNLPGKGLRSPARFRFKLFQTFSLFVKQMMRFASVKPALL